MSPSQSRATSLYYVQVFHQYYEKFKFKGKLGFPVTLEDILKEFIFHPSIAKIRKTYESNKNLSFHQVTQEKSVGLKLSLITKTINFFVENKCFPDDMNLSEVSTIFKKNDDVDKEYYRPVSVLFNLSKPRIMSLKESCTAHLMRSCKINWQTY